MVPFVVMLHEPAAVSIEAVIDRLVEAGCVAAEEEAEELVAAAPDSATLDSWIQRRELGEPLAWIIGWTQFCGRKVQIDQGVYVSRRRTEDLAHRAGALLLGRGGRGGAGQGGGRRAADLCTGAGPIALHLMAEAPGACVVGVDIDRRAVRCARRNGVHAIVGDVGNAGLPLRASAFDVVTAVAPYVPTGEVEFLPADVRRYEPRVAIDGGEEGLDVIRRVVASAARLLRPGGWLLLELGGDQDTALSSTLATFGFRAPTTWCDKDGDLRGLEAQASGFRDQRTSYGHDS